MKESGSIWLPPNAAYTGPSSLVQCPLQEMGGHGFDSGPWQTKVVKNGISYSSFGTQTYKVELGLVDPVSG